MKKIFGVAAGVALCAGLALTAHKFDGVKSSSATMVPASESEHRVEQCMASGGVEESCIFEEMKRTMLVNES